MSTYTDVKEFAKAVIDHMSGCDPGTALARVHGLC